MIDGIVLYDEYQEEKLLHPEFLLALTKVKDMLSDNKITDGYIKRNFAKFPALGESVKEQLCLYNKYLSDVIDEAEMDYIINKYKERQDEGTEKDLEKRFS